MAGRLSEAAGAGGAITPQLAEAAASAGAPPPGAQPQGQPPMADAAAAPSPPAGSNPPEQAPPARASAPTPEAGGAPAPEGELPNAQPATPEEQDAYDQAMGALAKILYSNDNIANSVVDQIDPNDKIGSTSKVAMLFIREMDRKINMPDAVVAPVTQEVVERMAELAEARHNIKYEPGEVEKILGATWEGVAAMFGSDGGQEGSQAFQQFVSQFDSGTLSAVKEQYEAALNG